MLIRGQKTAMGHQGSKSITVWISCLTDVQIIEHTHPALPTSYAVRYSALIGPLGFQRDGHVDSLCLTKEEAWKEFRRIMKVRGKDPRVGLNPKAMAASHAA
jgi:hypothetical protein